MIYLEFTDSTRGGDRDSSVALSMEGDSRAGVWCEVAVHSLRTSQAYRIRITEVRERIEKVGWL